MTHVTLFRASAGLMLVLLATGCTMLRENDNGPCEEPDRWSDDWYAQHSDDPIGARQKFHHGKAWPPYPRPVGKPQQFSHIYHAAHYWPLPYVCYDRAYVRDISEVQVNNGWMAEATLYDYHFDPETQGLNQAGLMHLQWILENCPAERRCAWVQQSYSPQESQARVANVRDEAIALVGEENVPPVMLRVGGVAGRPAAEVDALRRSFQSVQPAPQIEYTSAGATGTSGP